MASINDSEIAQITARAGVGRAGTMRAGAVPKVYELKANGSGEIIWNRDVTRDGDPDDTTDTSVIGRE